MKVRLNVARNYSIHLSLSILCNLTTETGRTTNSDVKIITGIASRGNNKWRESAGSSRLNERRHHKQCATSLERSWYVITSGVLAWVVMWKWGLWFTPASVCRQSHIELLLTNCEVLAGRSSWPQIGTVWAQMGQIWDFFRSYFHTF